MDQKRLFLAIAVSLAILLGFQYFSPHPARPPLVQEAAMSPRAAATIGSSPADNGAVPAPVPRNVPRVKIEAPSVQGSISLVGALIDDLVLRDYRETLSPDSPLVRLLEPRSDAQPYYVQYRWSTTADSHVKLPDTNTLWTASAPTLTQTQPVTLSWDNGEGLTFRIILSVDDKYMFTARQEVQNTTGAAVDLFPSARVRRDYTPEVSGYYVLHEGLLGVLGGTLKEMKYSEAKSDAEKNPNTPALDVSGVGGWAGITDKYWLAALIPDQTIGSTAAFRAFKEGENEGYQVDFITNTPQNVAAGASADVTTHLFAGAKVVRLLDDYQDALHIPNFDKAVDFGWFYFLTKPFFFCVDFLFHVTGNFGVAIMIFTVAVKLLFFPLANKSYKSMSKMKLLGPKMQAMRERFKDDPARMQQEMMSIYKTEKVNPASGCLPMLIQVPVFFSLYKVIFVTIEMRHAPFFGWIHDLSAIDPTNLFNLFGLLPFDPTVISPALHLGAWPLLMGVTMFLQQRLNPPPPDPVQAKIFQFMPIIFTFMLARFPAGLVIYWSWNNLLSIGQQWLIMRNTRLERPGKGRAAAVTSER
jgi:YidC/Oxa1 family membrane protein insertase